MRGADDIPGDGLRSRRLSGTRHRSRAAGFTLVEILIAAAVIGLGLVGVAAGFLHAVGGLEAGRQQTTAAFLAEQRIEQPGTPGLASELVDQCKDRAAAGHVVLGP